MEDLKLMATRYEVRTNKMLAVGCLLTIFFVIKALLNQKASSMVSSAVFSGEKDKLSESRDGEHVKVDSAAAAAKVRRSHEVCLAGFNVCFGARSASRRKRICES